MPFSSKTVAIAGGLRFEDRGHDGLLGSVADHIGGSLIAQQESQGIDEDRLACAGFAGQQV